MNWTSRPFSNFTIFERDTRIAKCTVSSDCIIIIYRQACQLWRWTPHLYGRTKKSLALLSVGIRNQVYITRIRYQFFWIFVSYFDKPMPGASYWWCFAFCCIGYFLLTKLPFKLFIPFINTLAQYSVAAMTMFSHVSAIRQFIYSANVPTTSSFYCLRRGHANTADARFHYIRNLV